MPTQANQPHGDGHQQQNHRMRKVLPRAGGECDKLPVVALTWE